MPDKNCVDKMRVSRANTYFSILFVAFIAIMIFLYS